MKLTHIIVLLLVASGITWVIWTNYDSSEKEKQQKVASKSSKKPRGGLGQLLGGRGGGGKYRKQAEKMQHLADMNSAKAGFARLRAALQIYTIEHGDAYPKKLDALVSAGMINKSDLYSAKDPGTKLVYLGGKKTPVGSANVLVYDPTPYESKYVTLPANGQPEVFSRSELNGYLKKQGAPLVKPPAKPKPGAKSQPKVRPRPSGGGYLDTLLKAPGKARHVAGIANMRNLNSSLMNYAMGYCNFPPDLETLVTRRMIQKRALYSIHNAKKKIVYLGKKAGMGGNNDFILAYDPIADHSGKHVVLFTGGSVKAIPKTDLNRRLKKQKAKPVK